MNPSIVHRALVTYSNPNTGEIRVKIPAVTGLSEVSITYIGRAPYNNFWFVPDVGSQITVTADDPDMTNVFWVQTDPGVLKAIRGYYGAFSDYTDQYAGGASAPAGALANTAAPMRFTTTDESDGVSIVNNSRITFVSSGVYNIQWSGQFENTDNAQHDISVWMRKNGTTAIPGTTGLISIPARKNTNELAHGLSGWNFVFTVNSADYYEFMWSTDSTAVSIQHYPEAVSPARPSTASIVLTVTPVTLIQTGAPGPKGADGSNSILELQIFS